MNISVSYEELEAAAAHLEAGRAEITDRLTALRSQVQNLITSGFVTDVASGRFAAAYESYSDGARTVIEQLTEIQSFLRETAMIMQETDQNIAARIA
ncbi:WXG100 family type VII secretion target [Canibacter zhoujuaniae]|uniref:WXG100 family type VII secretion target n=1 Tax=Canibacter zhoujuaniae TaxID=2708343 RepID=UPI0014239C95|nr:WXG100 family type VII secretion target [Canibacter zhoujuaniae]